MEIETKDRRVDLVVGRYKNAPKTKEARRLRIPVITINWVEKVKAEGELTGFKGFELN